MSTFFFSSKTTICFMKKHSQMFSSEQSLNGNFPPGIYYIFNMVRKDYGLRNDLNIFFHVIFGKN